MSDLVNKLLIEKLQAENAELKRKIIIKDGIIRVIRDKPEEISTELLVEVIAKIDELTEDL